MSNGYKKIFWGIFFATFNITFGIITILPAFVGWIIVASGIAELSENSDPEEFSQAKNISFILIGVTLVGSLLDLMGVSQMNPPVALLFFPLVLLTIELLLFHRLLEASVHTLTTLGISESAELYIRKDRTYIILAGMSLLLITLATFQLETWEFLAGIFAIITRVYLLSTISALSKEIWNDSDEMEESVDDIEHTIV